MRDWDVLSVVEEWDYLRRMYVFFGRHAVDLSVVVLSPSVNIASPVALIPTLTLASGTVNRVDAVAA